MCFRLDIIFQSVRSYRHDSQIYLIDLNRATWVKKETVPYVRINFDVFDPLIRSLRTYVYRSLKFSSDHRSAAYVRSLYINFVGRTTIVLSMYVRTDVYETSSKPFWFLIVISVALHTRVLRIITTREGTTLVCLFSSSACGVIPTYVLLATLVDS